MASDNLRIVCISDTHDIYYPLIPVDVDAVIHAGDITLSGSPDETLRFLRWFQGLPIKHKLFVGGNHDAFLERYGAAFMDDYKSIQMLWDSSYDLEGYKVWGSPVSPSFGHIKAFMKEREELETFWERIPSDTDIVVTHGPAYGYLDRVLPFRGHEHLGDVALYERLAQVAPLYHICGHIHGSRGMTTNGRGTTHINAAVLDEAYSPWYHTLTPIVIELPRKAAGEIDADSITNSRV